MPRRASCGYALPQAFALYAEEIVCQRRYPVIHESEAVIMLDRLAKVNEALDAVMRKHHSGIATVRAQAAWYIQMCQVERRHCKRMLAELAERKVQYPEAAERRKGV